MSTPLTSSRDVLIVVNGQANGGRAGERWRRVRAALDQMGFPYKSVQTASGGEVAEVLEKAWAQGIRTVVAAGGDGTVHSVLNALIDPETDRLKGEVALGAIGLGSSNDFHKPFSATRTLADCPVRIDAGAAALVDVGKVTYTDEAGERGKRYFLLNASLGFVAEGNAFFNSADRTLGFLKRRHVEAAIIYTALVNLLRFRALRLRMRLADEAGEIHLKTVSLGMLKRVHFAGGMYYDTDVAVDDGSLDLVSWGDLGRMGILKTMKGLYAGRFRDNPQARYWRTRRIHVTPEEPAHLELDGEVVRIREAEIQVMPRLLKLCG